MTALVVPVIPVGLLGRVIVKVFEPTRPNAFLTSSFTVWLLPSGTRILRLSLAEKSLDCGSFSESGYQRYE